MAGGSLYDCFIFIARLDCPGDFTDFGHLQI